MEKLKLTVKPEEFFQERVAKAIGNQKIALSSEVEFYLVRLLCDFISPNEVETANGQFSVFDVPLTLLLKEALESPAAQKLKIYKVLGDTSLYISGYFQDFFNSKTFDMSYYVQLGANAYENLSNLHREKMPPQSGVFVDLSKNFSRLVDIVAEVAEEINPAKDTNLLSLYERWTKTQSDRLRRKLENSGIVPAQVSKILQ